MTVKTLPGSQWQVQRIMQGRVLNSMNDAGVTTLTRMVLVSLLHNWKGRGIAHDYPWQRVYEAIGGMPTFRKIVSGFYAQVPDDDILNNVPRR